MSTAWGPCRGSIHKDEQEAREFACAASKYATFFASECEHGHWHVWGVA